VQVNNPEKNMSTQHTSTQHGLSRFTIRADDTKSYHEHAAPNPHNHGDQNQQNKSKALSLL